jgi:hypothetical protein
MSHNPVPARHRFEIWGLTGTLAAAWLIATLGAPASAAAERAVAEKPTINRPPSAADWAKLATLPDFSGVWNPNISDQNAQIKTNPVPWKPVVQARIDELGAEEKAGRPRGLFVNCLPEAMPSWMLITHNAMEILFTPGRVTILGESDGNRLRRIYTDGRSTRCATARRVARSRRARCSPPAKSGPAMSVSRKSPASNSPPARAGRG